MEQNDIYIRQMLIVAAVALFLAIFPIWPYGYYTLLRLIVCGVAAFGAYTIIGYEKLRNNRIPFIIIALLFNPFIPIHLEREIWAPIDVGVGVYFIVVYGLIGIKR